MHAPQHPHPPGPHLVPSRDRGPDPGGCTGLGRWSCHPAWLPISPPPEDWPCLVVACPLPCAAVPAWPVLYTAVFGDPVSCGLFVTLCLLPICAQHITARTHTAKALAEPKHWGLGDPRPPYSRGNHSLVRNGAGCARAPPTATTIGPEPELRPLAPVQSSVPQDRDERMLELIREKLKERFCVSAQESLRWA